MPPLVSSLDCAMFECPECVADAFQPAAWITAEDQLARAIGHDDDYLSDDNGAACSTYHADPTVRRLFAVADAVDRALARVSDARRMARAYVAPPTPYDLPPADQDTVYVYSDDRGFWSVAVTTAANAEQWRRETEGLWYPTYCTECGGDANDPDGGCLCP